MKISLPFIGLPVFIAIFLICLWTIPERMDLLSFEYLCLGCIALGFTLVIISRFFLHQEEWRGYVAAASGFLGALLVACMLANSILALVVQTWALPYLFALGIAEALTIAAPLAFITCIIFLSTLQE